MTFVWGGGETCVKKFVCEDQILLFIGKKSRSRPLKADPLESAPDQSIVSKKNTTYRVSVRFGNPNPT